MPVIAIFALVSASGCDDKPAAPAPTAPQTTAPAARFSADPERDLGAGEPGAACATNRLGKQFTKDGVTYTCKGPKPYKWRP